VKLVQHVYSCLFGEFLCNTERERSSQRVRPLTMSVWTLLSRQNIRFVNVLYLPTTLPRVCHRRVTCTLCVVHFCCIGQSDRRDLSCTVKVKVFEVFKAISKNLWGSGRGQSRKFCWKLRAFQSDLAHKHWKPVIVSMSVQLLFLTQKCVTTNGSKHACFIKSANWTPYVTNMYMLLVLRLTRVVRRMTLC